MKKSVIGKDETLPPADVTGSSMNDDRAFHQRISEKAYELYEKRGQHHGYDLDDWLSAERAILTGRAEKIEVKSSPAPQPAPGQKAGLKRNSRQRAAS